MSRICVKHLSKNASEAQLKEAFGKRGEVTDVRIVRTQAGKSRQFAFVGFRSDDMARDAVKYFNGTFLLADGAKVIVELAVGVNDTSKVADSRSRHTQKKLKKEEKRKEKEAGESADMQKKDKQLESKLKKTNADVDQGKAEFMEAMKKRSDASFWANDAAATVRSRLEPTNSGTDNSDSDDDEDVNDFAHSVEGAEGDDNDDESEEIRKEHANDKTKTFAEDVSDMDFLRSKVKKEAAPSHDDDGKVVPIPPQANSEAKSGRKGSAKCEKPKAAAQTEEASVEPPNSDDVAVESDELDDTGRLFVRNLPYSCTEDELRELFITAISSGSDNSVSSAIVTEVHMPIDEDKRNRGYAFIQYLFPEQANKAVAALDGSAFHGRLIHVMQANRRRDADGDGNAVAASGSHVGKKLSAYQLKKEAERKKLAGKQDSWNASFVRSDAVVDMLAASEDVKRGDIMDTSEVSGGEMAVRLALGESFVVDQNRKFFADAGVDLSALQSSLSSSKATQRSTTTILVKNLPHGSSSEELESMFARFGGLRSFLMPESGMLALVDFVEPVEARAAFKGLAYRRFKNMPLYLEWAPLGVLRSASASSSSSLSSASAPSSSAKSTADNSDAYSTLFIKNLAFSSTESDIRRHITQFSGKEHDIRIVSIPVRPGGNGSNMGFGFVEYKSISAAETALKRLNGSVLDGHTLQVKFSDKRLSAGAATASSDSAEGLAAAGTGAGAASAKLIVRNVAFQATPAELRSLFSAYGKIQRLRIPRKVGGGGVQGTHRGFAFVEFASRKEAALAMASLSSAHLYGRHLIIEWAKAGDDDGEGDAGDADNSSGIAMHSEMLKGDGSSLSSLRKKAKRDVSVLKHSENTKRMRTMTDFGDGAEGDLSRKDRVSLDSDDDHDDE